MPITIFTPGALAFPGSVIPPTVMAKESWTDTWVPQLNLIPTHVSTSSAGQDLSRVVFHHRHGMVKGLTDAAAVWTFNRNYDDWWIQIETQVWNGLTWLPLPFWTGRVSSEDKAEYASSDVRAGVQQFVAYGPEQLLRKKMIGSSYHAVPLFSTGGVDLVGHQLNQVGWVPPMNNTSGSEEGTRSENVHNARGDGIGIYLYGGTSLWNNRQHVEYLLQMFMNKQLAAGPEWRLTGLTAPLENLRTPIVWGTTQTLFQMLRKLIPLDRGLDFVVLPLSLDRGFEVNVFAVSAVAYTFGGFTLPANPNLITLDTGAGRDLTPPPRIVITHDRKYKRILVMGRRIVVCGSLWGSKAPRVARVPEVTLGVPSRVGVDGESSAPSCVKKWNDEIEAEYLAGGGVDGVDHDNYREQDKFKDVFSSLAAPPGWLHNDGTASPWVNNLGQLVVDDPGTIPDDSISPFQQTLRNTLSYLPFKQGEDWTAIRTQSLFTRGDSTDVDDHQAAYQPPMAWIFDPTTSAYRSAKDLGIGVQPQRFDWGLHLRCSPNHIMGREHFEGAGTAYSAMPPHYDWQEVILTIAWEADYRYANYWQLPNATTDDEVLQIEVDAELHYLAPNTVVAAPQPPALTDRPTPPEPPVGTPPTTPPPGTIPVPRVILSGDSKRVIRVDSNLMGLTMAGAISRYGAERRRARVGIAGLPIFHGLVGGMLGTVNENGHVHVVNGPITGVTWSLPQEGLVSTTMRAGFSK